MAVPETTARATAAVDDLYRRHVGDVYRYTYAVLGNHADAEDVTQTTFVNALRAIERGETPEEPERWLMVIAHNLVRQRWRQAAARPTVVELETDVPDAADDEQEYELEELVRALQRIPETQREALVMRELEGRSYRDIAAVMGLTTSALETVLFRARRSLADELENVVTCQNAELSISKRLDGRLSRKERRRLEEHLAECPDCARLAAFETRQRKAFKGLALLPLPVGLALFKGAPSAAAATSLPTIGLAASGGETTGAGAAGAGATGTATGGATAGGSLAGGIALKVAAIAATITVAAGVGYKGIQMIRDRPSGTKTAAPHVEKASTRPIAPIAPATPPRMATESTHATTPRPVEHKPAAGRSNARTPAPVATPSPETHAAATVGTDGSTSPSHHTQTPVVAKSPAPASDPPAPTDGAKPKPQPKPVASPGGSKDAPKTSPPKAGTTPPGAGTGGSGSGSGAAGGGTTTPAAPPAVTPPSSPPAGPPVTPPVSVPSASPPPATPPGPPATPPVTTPPSTPPTTPPSEQPPGDTSSGSTGGDTSGSTGGDTSGSTGDSGSGAGSPSNGTDPWEHGQKNGHHKGNHDDKHPGDS